MKAASKTAATTGVTLTTGTVDEFFAQSRERARKLDRGERIPAEIRVVFEDPADLMQVLSAQRIRVLHAARTGPLPVSQLASELKRDRQAVMRDVRLLESFGLLKTLDTPNPGHGRRRIVAPLAAKYQLVANI
jgi:predicted transcriptional regulator